MCTLTLTLYPPMLTWKSCCHCATVGDLVLESLFGCSTEAAASMLFSSSSATLVGTPLAPSHRLSGESRASCRTASASAAPCFNTLCFCCICFLCFSCIASAVSASLTSACAISFIAAACLRLFVACSTSLASAINAITASCECTAPPFFGCCCVGSSSSTVSSV